MGVIDVSRRAAGPSSLATQPAKTHSTAKVLRLFMPAHSRGSPPTRSLLSESSRVSRPERAPYEAGSSPETRLWLTSSTFRPPSAARFASLRGLRCW
jgi:hypothetical protein